MLLSNNDLCGLVVESLRLTDSEAIDSLSNSMFSIFTTALIFFEIGCNCSRIDGDSSTAGVSDNVVDADHLRESEA